MTLQSEQLAAGSKWPGNAQTIASQLSRLPPPPVACHTAGHGAALLLLSIPKAKLQPTSGSTAATSQAYSVLLTISNNKINKLLLLQHVCGLRRWRQMGRSLSCWPCAQSRGWSLAQRMLLSGWQRPLWLAPGPPPGNFT